MKKYLLITLLLVGCFTTKTIPLKNQYQTTPFQSTSTNNKDVVWDKLIDLFAQNGLSIKIIDRSSGLIVSDRSSLTWTHEDKNGKLIKPNAFVVLAKQIDVNKNVVKPGGVSGEWNVRIKDNGSSGTIINVNLVNLKETVSGYKIAPYDKDIRGVSTGNFEKIIFDNIK